MNGETAELPVRAEMEAVPEIRRFVAAELSSAAVAVREDAAFVASELVTNALLHGDPPVTLRMSRLPDGVRLEVEDQGRRMPVQLQPGADAMTGRGLGLVAAVSSSWGVTPGRSGSKVVWAELGGAAGDAPELDADALLEAWSDEDEQFS